MKHFGLRVVALLWAMFFVVCACTDHASLPTTLRFLDTTATADNSNGLFRSGVRVQLTANTSLNQTLLTARDRYATLFTDPNDHVWQISTAENLSDLDFAEAGYFQANTTESGATFYYGKVPTWEIQAECVVYLAAGADKYVVIRRYQNQGACPTSAGYAEWLPDAENVSNIKESPLWAYGANNHPETIKHGVFNNVNAYGNDVYGQPCGDFHHLSDCAAYTGIRHTGIKWDSAEFVNRYFIATYNHSPMWEGPAGHWYQEARNYGLKRLANCGSVRPEVGDMLVSEGGPAGHAAIIREVTDHSVTVIQQNWFESPADNHHTLTMNSSGHRYCVAPFGDSYPIAGWVRK